MTRATPIASEGRFPRETTSSRLPTPADVWAGSVDIRERSEALGSQRPLPRMDPSNVSAIGSCAIQISFRLPFDQDVSKGAT